MEKRRDIRNFYVDEEFKSIYEKFKKIVEREHVSASDKIRELIRNYTSLHADGNPQQRLDYVLRNGVPYKAPEKCWFCKKPPIMIVMNKRSKVDKAACEKHAQDCLDSGLWEEKQK